MVHENASSGGERRPRTEHGATKANLEKLFVKMRYHLISMLSLRATWESLCQIIQLFNHAISPPEACYLQLNGFPPALVGLWRN